MLFRSEWIADCLQHMQGKHMSIAEPIQQAEDDWVAHVNEVASKTLFTGTQSWYMGANIPGKPRVFLPYIGGLGTYTNICNEVVADGYRGFEFEAGQGDSGHQAHIKIGQPSQASQPLQAA